MIIRFAEYLLKPEWNMKKVAVIEEVKQVRPSFFLFERLFGQERRGWFVKGTVVRQLAARSEVE